MNSKKAKSKKRIVFVLAFLLLGFSGWAQQNATDSIANVLLKLEDDSTKVNALIELSILARGADSEGVIRWATEAKELSERINFHKGLAIALKWIGMGYSDQDMYVQSTLNWQESLRIFEEMGDKNGIANLLSNLGTTYNNQGDDEKALELYLRSLQIAEEIGDKMRTLTVSLNIGLIYQKKIATLDKALEYYSIALNLADELDYQDGIGTASVNIGLRSTPLAIIL